MYLLHLEVDEEHDHEQDEGRLAEIQASCNEGRGASFATVIRIGLDERDYDEGPVFKKKRRADGSVEYRGSTVEFHRRIEEARELIERVFQAIQDNDTSLSGIFRI
jgi:hypothetical protein